MCGIVAAVADRNIVPVLLEGLRKLEYRGYDSAGLALINDAGLQRLRSVGRVAELTAQVDETQPAATPASRIRAGRRTAFPASATPIRTFPAGWPSSTTGSSRTTKPARAPAVRGLRFTSDTDTEVVGAPDRPRAEEHPDLLTAVRQPVAQLQGAYAIAVLREADPGRVVVAREGAPLLLGLPTTAATPPRTPRRWCRSRGAWSIWRTATVPS
jgi:glucosamine--fructose-6-phosphate aminotransferase (isomerizing)